MENQNLKTYGFKRAGPRIPFRKSSSSLEIRDCLKSSESEEARISFANLKWERNENQTGKFALIFTTFKGNNLKEAIKTSS